MYNFDCIAPVLIMGCGGGYDIFTGLPIYFSLVNQGVQTYLANFSFTDHDLLRQYQALSKYVYLINPHLTDKLAYFPELFLANKLGVSVIAFEYEHGVVTLEKSYIDVINTYGIKTIILVDGGCDSVLFGDEKELATPVEDMMNIFVVNKLLNDHVISLAYLSVLGITADFYEGVDPKDIEKNIKYLTETNALVCSYQLNNKCLLSQKYIETFLDCCPHKSIVNCSIVESIMENYGLVLSKHLAPRCSSMKIEISQLTSTNYVFKLSVVANTIKYLDLLTGIDDSDEIDKIIMEYHDN